MTFVSTSAATVVEILTRPAAIARWRERPARVPLALADEGALEQLYAFSRGADDGLPRHDPDHVASRLELDLGPRRYAITVRHGLRDRDLQLARDPRHVLTVTRTVSLSTSADGYWLSPQNGQVSDRACSGFRQCQQNPLRGTSRALSRLRMYSSSVALWSMSAAVSRSSSSSEARW